MRRVEVLTPAEIAPPSAAVIVDDPSDYQGTYARDGILYRVLSCRIGIPVIDSGGLVICRTHVVELRNYRFAGRALRVVAVGVRERLHSVEPPTCGMCAAAVARGNECHCEECATPLHPQWPAVYCSNECASEDR